MPDDCNTETAGAKVGAVPIASHNEVVLRRFRDAKSREDFMEEVIAHFDGVGRAAHALNVSYAAIWNWGKVSLSVEGAVGIAEAVGIPYEIALRWADRRRPAPTRAAARAKREERLAS